MIYTIGKIIEFENENISKIFTTNKETNKITKNK